MSAVADPSIPLNKLQWGALAVGVLGGALCVLGAFVSPDQFYQAYLVSFLYWCKLSLGCLAIAFLYRLVGGYWGRFTAPFFEAALPTVLLMALLFIPLVFGLDRLYPWTDPVVASDVAFAPKGEWLNKPFFLGRSAGYLGLWSLLAVVLMLLRRRTFPVPLPERAGNLQGISGIGMVLLFLTANFAAIDWAMSLDPYWYSAIYGGIWAMGALMSGFALVVAGLTLLVPLRPPAGLGKPETLNDLGSLLLAFTMLWAYTSFSQYIIIWSANITEEVVWYLHRLDGWWEWVSLSLIFLHFALPFFCLLLRDVKQDPRLLGGVAVFLLVMHYVEVFWTIQPQFDSGRLVLHWLDVVTPLAIGGFWLGLAAGQLRHLLPQTLAYVGDTETMDHGEIHG